MPRAGSSFPLGTCRIIHSSASRRHGEARQFRGSVPLFSGLVAQYAMWSCRAISRSRCTGTEPRVILPHIDDQQYRRIMVTATIDRHCICWSSMRLPAQTTSGFAHLAERDPLQLAYFPSASWTMIKKPKSVILASPASTSTWTESLPTKSLLGV